MDFNQKLHKYFTDWDHELTRFWRSWVQRSQKRFPVKAYRSSIRRRRPSSSVHVRYDYQSGTAQKLRTLSVSFIQNHVLLNSATKLFEKWYKVSNKSLNVSTVSYKHEISRELLRRRGMTSLSFIHAPRVRCWQMFLTSEVCYDIFCHRFIIIDVFK